MQPDGTSRKARGARPLAPMLVLVLQERVLRGVSPLGGVGDLFLKKKSLTIHESGDLSGVHAVVLGNRVCVVVQ